MPATFFNDIFLRNRYQSGNCGVSIVRSGEAMEQGLRDCCRSIRIGKILVESDAETHVAKVVYARFPDDIAKRQVLLMYPIMSTGNTVVQVRAWNGPELVFKPLRNKLQMQST